MCQRHVAIVVAVQGINAEGKESSSSSNGTGRHCNKNEENPEKKPTRKPKTSLKLHFEGKMMTPFEDFVYLINHVLLGEEPVSEKVKKKIHLTDNVH